MKKVVLITGASSGIGLSIANYLSTKEYIVVGTSRNPQNYSGFNFKLEILDISDSLSIATLVEKTIAEFGKIDVLINNAGVGITGPIEEIPTKEMKNHFDTNFFGPIEMMKAVLPQMRSQNSGLIINITSIAGYMGLPFRGVYSASKGALELITEAMRMEVKQFGIEITNVAPGDFATSIAQNRFHLPVFENSFYKKNYANTLQMMNNQVDSGENPDQIAHAIMSIIESKTVKIHYKVGSFLQKFSIVLKRLLPDLIFEKMLMNHFKL